MAFEQPQSRNEAILQNMLGAENELVPPQSRIEALLQAILLQGVPDGAVTTDKLADGAVTYDKLAEALKNLIDGKADKEGNWELIDTVTIEEEVSEIKKNVDGNGNALELKGIRFFVYCPSDSRATASTFYVSAYARTDITRQLGRLYRQNIIGRSDTQAFFQCKVENGYWYDSYEMAQGIAPITATTYRTNFLDADYYNRINENNYPFIKSWKLATNTIPVGTTIKVYGIKEQ